MKGYCRTRGHSDVPHRLRANCRDWKSVFSTPVTLFASEEDRETMPVVSSEPEEMNV